MIYYDIVDDKRRAILPYFLLFKNKGFYLAGGTGLALQIGHRDSVDFDFFHHESFNTQSLIQEINQTFTGYKVIVSQEEKDTLSMIIDDDIKVSLFSYPYPLIGECVSTDFFPIASLEDIGGMKLSAIADRATYRDYIDIYYILKNISLDVLIEKTKLKMPMFDGAILLKSLVYFDDVREESLIFKHGHEVTFATVKENLTEQVSEYSKRLVGIKRI